MVVSGPNTLRVPGNSSCRSLNTPPFTARGSPIRSNDVFVSQPSPLNPRPPCSAGTAGSAPASASGKTGYAFLSTPPGARAAAGAGDDGGAPPPPPPPPGRPPRGGATTRKREAQAALPFRVE